MNDLSIGEVVSEIEAEYGVRIRPRLITSLFYDGYLRCDICPVRNGRRHVPSHYIPHIVRSLQRRGKLPRNPRVLSQ